MSFQLRENDYIVCFWHCEIPDDIDFLMILIRNTRWVIQYRFRYIKDSKIWGSTDKKSFYKGTAPLSTSLEKMLKACDTIWHILIKKGFQKAIRQTINGDMDKFTKVLKKYPDLFHWKKIAKL